ncbi:heat shock protein DnaJ, partial [Ramicandelaber brevisporus]
SHYEHLGLTPAATRSEIKSQYYALSKKLHPDTNPGDEAAHNQFIRITEAYDILYDDVQRKEYDRTL